MSKMLVIPDIHCRDFWKKPCEEWDGEIVFLGDFFDPYPQEGIENPYENSRQAIEFILKNKERTTVIPGNHDLHYIFEREGFIEGSRFCRDKEPRQLLQEIKELFKGALVKDNVIFSHAGITEDWAYDFLANYMKYDESALEGDLVLETAEVLQDTPLSDYNQYYINALSMIGSSRGGYDNCGSCVWADVSEHFTHKLSGFSPKSYNKFQIFGHTWLRSPIIQEYWACLDCGGKAFVVDTNTCEIKEYV